MANHPGHDLVLVLDFGGQYTQLIARRIREQGVYCEIRPCTDAPERPPRLKGIVFSGGPSSVYDEGAPPFDPRWFDTDVPFLGICYGLQLMAHHLGGRVERSDHREYGHAEIEILDPKAPILRGIDGKNTVWMSHGDRLMAPPRGFRTIASSQSCPIAGVADEAGRRFGIQFHPEVTHTAIGERIFRNFLFEVCGCSADWTMGSFLDEQTAMVRDKVGQEHVLCALSGGVDSAVVATLLHKALGPRLHCVFVDNGVLRKGERVAVESEFADLGVRVVDARKRFLQALDGVSDPERKRKIIGETFIRVFEDEAKTLAREAGSIRYLAQGTLYPDVIESVSFRGPSATIKSHHNVGGLPERMDMKLIEPLRELFKDEVRRLGRELGLSESRVGRQPFPGPGLAVRILGPVDEESVRLLGDADAIVDAEIRAAGLYDGLWQSFAVLLPVKSVGVMGDDRTYERTCVVRAVQSLDGMTANVAELPWPVLHRISSRIINEVRGINRVCYDISSKPPATIEWE